MLRSFRSIITRCWCPTETKGFSFLSCNLTFKPLLRDVYLIHSTPFCLPLETARSPLHSRQGFALGGWNLALKRPGGWINEICGAQPRRGTESLGAEMSRGFVTLVRRRFSGGLSSVWGFLSSIRSHGAWSCGRLWAQEVNVRAPPLRPCQMSSGCVCAGPASPDTLQGVRRASAGEQCPWSCEAVRDAD